MMKKSYSRKILVIASLLALLASPAHADEFKLKIASVAPPSTPCPGMILVSESIRARTCWALAIIPSTLPPESTSM